MEHNFFRNIVGHHTLCGAFCRKLGEVVIFAVGVDIVLLQNVNKLRKSRRNPHAFFVFNASVTLTERFLDNQRKVFFLLFVFCLVEIHKHRHKRRLSVGGHKRYNLILNHLNAVFNLLAESFFGNLRNFVLCNLVIDLAQFRLNLFSYFLSADVHKRRKMRKAYALSAVLARRNLCDNLG